MRIADIKTQLKESTKNFYLIKEISDETRIGSKVWKQIKADVCENENYKKESWY